MELRYAYCRPTSGQTRIELRKVVLTERTTEKATTQRIQKTKTATNQEKAEELESQRRELQVRHHRPNGLHQQSHQQRAREGPGDYAWKFEVVVLKGHYKGGEEETHDFGAKMNTKVGRCQNHHDRALSEEAEKEHEPIERGNGREKTNRREVATVKQHVVHRLQVETLLYLGIRTCRQVSKYKNQKNGVPDVKDGGTRRSMLGTI